MSIEQMLHIIAGECKNSCTNTSEAITHFFKCYPDQFDPIKLTALVAILDFDALRSEAYVLHQLTKPR